MLKPIKPKRMSDQVFEQLKDLIFRGQLKPGERLLTERELAQELGVSRPTIREAINKLVAMHLLEHRQGQGTFVNPPTTGADKNPLAALLNGQDASLMDLLEIRLGLECNAVALAARRATEEDVREIEKCVQEMAAAVRAGNLGSDADITFHMALAYASKNIVQIHIMKSLYDLLFHGIQENLQHLYTEPINLDKVLRQHTDILNAIRKRDPDEAYAAMKRHITFVQDFFQERNIE
ncbi:MAG: FadR family transcriptional regulator [Deltaproteobacteria bacterium]|nr:FadR family transcriptional regulator [Deltaproteobacteria bacterium]